MKAGAHVARRRKGEVGGSEPAFVIHQLMILPLLRRVQVGVLISEVEAVSHKHHAPFAAFADLILYMGGKRCMASRRYHKVAQGDAITVQGVSGLPPCSSRALGWQTFSTLIK